MGPLKVTFKRASMEAEAEFGSLAELAGAIQDQGAALIQMFGSDMETVVVNMGGSTALATGTVGEIKTGETNAAPVETAAQKKKREKQEKEDAKAASEARRTETIPPAAPPPIPPTPPAATAAIDTTPNAGGIPNFLDATKQAAAAPPVPPVAPPPPPAPPAPPVPPAGVLAAKIIPHMEGIAATQTDGGKAWVDWLASSGIVVPGATFEEAMKVIRMQSDEKLAPIASALGIAA